MNKQEIVNKVENYVKNTCEKDCTGHDWWHIWRVYKNAILINKQEKADEFVVTMIALLHDLYDHKFFEGNAEPKLIQTLKDLKVYDNMDKRDIENIIDSCVNLGFSSNLVNKKEICLEGKIVQDADRLDAIGAIGIARVFTYGGKKEKMIYDPDDNEVISEEEYQQKGSRTSISHFSDKMLKLKDLMNTNTAKLIAQERHQYLEDFLQEFFEEWNGEK